MSGNERNNMDRSDQVLGIDFGTSNSYFCRYNIVNTENLKIREFDFGNDQIGSLASSILYRNSINNNILIGSEAEQEWGEATLKERKDYILRTHFKPDIAINEEAKKNAIDFLRTVKENLQKKRVDFFPDQQTVVMGIPALTNEAFKSAMKEIVAKAGYNKVEFLPEPLGALLYHLWNRDLSASQINSGILVIDFGGGTCDFSYLQHLNVRHIWGDMSLGGRLFDDLFFQWFLEQNPDLADHLNANDEYFIHWYVCRKIKEDFSNKIRSDKKQKVNKRNVWENYSLKNMTWDEFISRAKKYKAHKSFIKYLSETEQGQSILTDNSTINLIDWFKSSLIDGLEKHEIRSSDINKVILTGGSSQWLFVEEILFTALHLDETKLLSSVKPKAAISEGLVLYPHLKHKLNISKRNLSTGLDHFIKTQVQSEIDLKLSNIIDHLSREVSSIIFGQEIKSRILKFRENGGTVQVLNENIYSDIQFLEPQIKAVIEKNMAYWGKGLQETILEITKKWFGENGIKFFANNIDFNSDYKQISSIDSGLDLGESIVKSVNVFISSIIGAIVGSLAGGSGIALFLEGPIGWIIGFLIAAVIAFMVLKLGREKAKIYAESKFISHKILKRVMTNKKIETLLNKARKKVENKIKEELKKDLEEPVSTLLETLKYTIKQEIDSLGVITQL